jgi:hypothetical protein
VRSQRINVCPECNDTMARNDWLKLGLHVLVVALIVWFIFR